MKNRTANRIVVVLVAVLSLITPPTSTIRSALANDSRPADKKFPWALPAVEEGRLSTAAMARGNLSAGLPVSFEANHGQADVRFKFLSRGDRRNLFLMPTEALMFVTGSPKMDDRSEETAALNLSPIKQEETPSAWLRMILVGANPAAKMAGDVAILRNAAFAFSPRAVLDLVSTLPQIGDSRMDAKGAAE